MDGPEATSRGPVIGPAVWITGTLALGASTIVLWVWMAFQPQDIEALESPLVLAVAHQIEFGPRDLYGPYDGRYPLVLIHAPLYYRLAALSGWMLLHAGLATVTAGLVAGRSLSAIGYLATLVSAYRLASVGGMPVRAGGWAALLVAATPIAGGIPFEVRPDMPGIAFQTSGILLVLTALATPHCHITKLTAGAACFAVAVCIKQQYVVAPLVSLTFALAAWRHRRLSTKAVLLFMAVGLAPPLLYFGAEQWLTDGGMSRSVFLAARYAGHVHPANWPFAANLLFATIWKCVGPILLLGAAFLAIVREGHSRARRRFVLAGSLLIGVVVALSGMQFFAARVGISGLLTAGLIVIIAAIIPICFVVERTLLGNWLDRALWAYLVAELAFTIILWRLSNGGWFNYAIEAVVIGCVLTARALARALARSPSQRALWPAVMASLAVPIFAWTDVKQVVARREVENKEINQLLKSVPTPASELYFAGLPGANRMYGRRELVYDPWLYPVFEAIGQAETRSIWLESALATGAVRYVATTSSSAEVDGLSRSLPALGFRRSVRVGRYFLWVRPTSTLP